MDNDTNRLPPEIMCDECGRDIDAGESVSVSRFQNDGIKTYCTDCKPIPLWDVITSRKSPNTRIRLCENCMRQTYVNSVYTKYCSDRCSRQYNNARLAEDRKLLRTLLRANRKCHQCGDIFTPPRSDAKYCSSACRQKAYNIRKRA